MTGDSAVADGRAAVTAPAVDRCFAEVFDAIADIDGWMTKAQAQRLWDRAADTAAGDRIVEIGSYRGRSAIVLASAAPPGVEVVAIDPHGGNDRGPLEWEGTPDEGQADYEHFVANLGRMGVAERITHVRRPSQEALDEVTGEVALLYIDGAHRYRPARADIERWGARVAVGGTMLIHDAFCCVGVTVAQATVLLGGARFLYLGRSGSLAEYRRVDLGPRERTANAARQLGELGYVARNVGIKVLIVSHLRPLTRLLGGDGVWPY